MYSITDYHYDLPEKLIAQFPNSERDGSRLLHLDRNTGATIHHRFRDIAGLLDPDDVLVVNNTKVIPARLTGKKSTGGKIEVLLLDTDEAEKEGSGSEKRTLNYRCLVKSSKRAKPGSRLTFGPQLAAEVLDFHKGLYSLKFEFDDDFDRLLSRIGTTPLPPYIRRGPDPENRCDDRDAYQTIYASKKGAVAAPTAGLHFTERLMGEIKSRGIEVAEITLHVGYGTFLPVRVDDIREHRMHHERYAVDHRAAAAINRAKEAGRRVVAVGTTCVRTLEHVSDDHGVVTPGTGTSDLFIYPGYRFRSVDAMITNFHLPGSSLLMLVSGFAGREKVLGAYDEAIRNEYRFFSYGDAMLII